MTGWTRVANVVRMPPRRWVDIAAAMVVAARIERRLRSGDLTRAAAIAGVQVRFDGTAAAPGTVADVRLDRRDAERLDVAWRVLRVPPFDGTCLRRALVGGYFLRARGPALRVGVTKREGEVFAHAWIEIDGVSLDPDGPAEFAMLGPITGEAPA